MTIGTMLRQWLVKLEWFSTLFPRIPVPIQQKIQKHLEVSTVQLDGEKNLHDMNWEWKVLIQYIIFLQYFFAPKLILLEVAGS